MPDERKTITRLLAPMRVFEANIPISGPVAPAFSDWPSHMQDQVLEAAAKIEQEKGVHLTIWRTSCEHDPDGWFVRVALLEDRSEVIRLATGDLLNRKDLQ